jgi:D-tyrosyl-tRNA(Tyr) deacylase
MRSVVQRVSSASVDVAGARVAAIGPGLLVLLGVRKGDTAADLEWMAEKVLNLRIFDDAQGVMNLSVQDIAGELLVVSQFTLLADSRKGRRPSYVDAASPDEAKALYEAFCDRLAASGRKVERGVFQAIMAVSLVNDGPVTIVLDSEKRLLRRDG